MTPTSSGSVAAARLWLSEWIEQHIMLAEGVSAPPSKVRL
jgi:hypothetical protein